MTTRNKWRLVSLAGVVFLAFMYYVGDDGDGEADGVDRGGRGGVETEDGVFRVTEPGGEWVVGIPCPAGYRGRGEARWTEDSANPLVWWLGVESDDGEVAASCSCDDYHKPYFDARSGGMVQPFLEPEAFAESLIEDIGRSLDVADLQVDDARYEDTDKYDHLFRTLISMGAVQRRGEVRLTYGGEKDGKDVAVVYIAAFALAGGGNGPFSASTLYLSRPRCYACPSGREEECERLVARLDEGRQDNAALKSRVEQIVCQRTQNANQQVMSMGQQANAALMQQQEAFQASHAQQQQSQDHWADSWRDVIGEKQNVIDPQSGNPVRVDNAENTYFDPSGRPVQMSDDQIRDWARRNGGGAVDSRERFEYANPHLHRARKAR